MRKKKAYKKLKTLSNIGKWLKYYTFKRTGK
jgi:hypothetical protein